LDILGDRLSMVLRKRRPQLTDHHRLVSGIGTTNDVEQFLDNCDAVIVATPVESHWNIVCSALDQGKRVLCEKPLCTSFQEFYDIEGAAEEGQLTVGYTHLWHPRVEHMRARVERERPGNITVDIFGPNGDAFDWAPHAVAFAAALQPLGGMRLVFGNGLQPGRRVRASWLYDDMVYESDPCDPPPLTRMVNWWLSGQQDYRSELWRRVEPAVLGLCGGTT
jgi:hypothetical protein